MKFNYKKITLITLPIIIMLIIMNLALFYNNQNSLSDKTHLKGIVTIQVRNADGTIKSETQSDAIYAISYDYIMCYLWLNGCANVFPLNFPLTTFTTTATISTYTPYATVLTGLTLSSGTQSNGACQNVLSTNGLQAIVASGTSHSVGTNSITLTGSWTFTGASQVVQSICLVAATENSIIPQFSNAPLSGTTTSFASENFASQTLTTGQSISISWTFSF